MAVLIGRKQYMRLTARHRTFSEAYGEFRRDVDLEQLAIDPDDVFAAVRDKTRGRKVAL